MCVVWCASEIETVGWGFFTFFSIRRFLVADPVGASAAAPSMAWVAWPGGGGIVGDWRALLGTSRFQLLSESDSESKLGIP